jgi:hypothetical protein
MGYFLPAGCRIFLLKLTTEIGSGADNLWYLFTF